MNEIEFNLPMVGTAEDDETFQYFLLKVTPHSALISVLSRFEFPHEYRENFRLNLHADGFLALKKNIQAPLEGEAIKLPSSNPTEVLYRIELQEPLPSWSFFQKTKFESASIDEINKMVIALLKDSLFIKEGINIYLKHLVPYLSRILQLSTKNFDDLKSHILLETQGRVQGNIKKLEQIYESLYSNKERGDAFFTTLDIDLLRETCKSEIDLVLLQLSCGGVEDILAPLVGKIEMYSVHSYQAYLKSIKTLEHRLYRNYNTIVYSYVFYINKFTSQP